MKRSFGSYIRVRRLKRKFGLREFARSVPLHHSYLERIELGQAGPPKEEKILRMAELLGENPDVLLARAGCVRSDVIASIVRDPVRMTQLVREANGLRAEEYDYILSRIRTIKEVE